MKYNQYVLNSGEINKMKNKNNNIQKDDPMEIIKWLNPSFKKELYKHFTIEDLKRAIAKTNVSISKLTEEYKTEDDEPKYHFKHELLKDWHYDTVEKTIIYKGQEWKRYSNEKVRTYKIPSQYGHLEHGNIIKELLNARFDWFKKFKWEIYDPDQSAYIFLRNSKGKSSIYLDLDTLFTFSKEKIIEYNWKFHKHYYDEPSKDQFYEHNKNANRINQKTINNMFNTHIAKKFFSILEKEKPFGFRNY